MGNIAKFQQTEPLHCAQDLRAFIGFTVEDVVSDESDLNAKVLLRNKNTNESVWLLVDKALDGETLFVMHR